jgi:uncharacterized protein YdhG (YjbR/CyaY superfamily)
MELTTKPTTTSKYIANFPKEIQTILKRLRSTIKRAIPKSTEKISYGIPAFSLNDKNVIFFAGYEKHVSVYPAPRSSPEFKLILSAYKGGKGTVQFPIDEPIPYKLIAKIAKFRMAEHQKRIAKKK